MKNSLHPFWIWYPAQRSLPCSFVFFRREIELDGPCGRAIGTIAADSRYQLFINGKQVQRGPAPFDPRHQELDPVDLTPYLVAGNNCIGILVFSFGHAGDGTYVPGMPGLRFELALEERDRTRRIVSNSDWKCLWATCWPAGGHRRNFLRAFQEEFDARKYPYGWMEPGFDDSAWLSADELEVPYDKPLISKPHINTMSGVKEPCAESEYFSVGLRKRSIPFLEEEKCPVSQLLGTGFFEWKVSPEEYYEIYTKDAFVEHILDSEAKAACFPYEIPAGSIASGTSRVFLFELREEMIGFPYIEIRAEAGTVVEISFGERQNLDSLTICEIGNGSWKGQFVRLICRQGLNRFDAFDWDAVKFLSITIHNTTGPVTLEGAGITRIRYPFPHQADFSCSDELINRVNGGAINCCRNTSFETVIDNAVRERQNYQGEVALGYLTHYLACGEYRLARRCLTIFGDGQHPDGWFFDAYPGCDRLERMWQNTLGLFRWGSILDHGIYYLFHLYWYVLSSGDRSLLFELKDKIIRYCDWLEAIRRQHGGLLPVMPDDSSPEKISRLKATGSFPWCNGPLSVWMDSSGFQMQRHKKAALNIFYYGTLNVAVKHIAEWLNRPELAQSCVLQASSVKELICRYFQDEEGLIVDNLPWLSEENHGKRYHDRTLSMALLFGITGEAGKKKSLKMLKECPEPMGLSFPPNAYWRLRALNEGGEKETLLAELHNRWANMTALGIGNSFSESWALNGEFSAGAQCQNSSAGPHYAIFCGILGVRPISVGFSTYEINPLLHGLESYSGTVYVPGGSVEVSFQEKPVPTLELKLPAGGKAVIRPSRSIVSAQRDETNCTGELRGKSELSLTPQFETKLKFVFKKQDQ